MVWKMKNRITAVIAEKEWLRTGRDDFVPSEVFIGTVVRSGRNEFCGFVHFQPDREIYLEVCAFV